MTTPAPTPPATRGLIPCSRCVRCWIESLTGGEMSIAQAATASATPATGRGIHCGAAIYFRLLMSGRTSGTGSRRRQHFDNHPTVSHHVTPPPLDLGEGRRARSTTVLCVQRGGTMVMAPDVHVTLGSTVMKQTARKIRKLYNDKVLAAFAGSTADAFSLFTRFEAKLAQYGWQLGGSGAARCPET